MCIRDSAACVIAALGDWYRVSMADREKVAVRVGADVTFFLNGGTARMAGIGERITRLDPLDGFVLVVAVPEYRLSTPEVYQTWDRLDYPSGEIVDSRRLPPQLRSVEISNDLTPAALELEPALGDLIADLCERWERPVMMSGSGSAVFACFADHDEASDAMAAAADIGVRRACAPLPGGVRRLDR